MAQRAHIAENEAYPAEIRSEVMTTASNLALVEWRTWMAAVAFLTLAFVLARMVEAFIEALFSIEIGELGNGAVLTVVIVPLGHLWYRIWRRIVNWVLINRRDEVLRAHLALHPSVDRSAQQGGASDRDNAPNSNRASGTRPDGL